MQTLEKNPFSLSTTTLVVFWLVALIIMLATSYEMIAMFVDTLHDKANTVTDEVMQAGFAGY